MRTRTLVFSRALLSLLSAVVVTAACGSEGDARDAGTPDTGVLDGGNPDTGVVDAGKRDAGPVDSGVDGAMPMDSGMPDAGPVDVPAPVDGGGLRAVKVASSSAGHACAVLSNGRVRCWGLNDNGQIGRPFSASASRCRTTSSSTTQLACDPRPVEVEGLTDAVDVVMGAGSTCVLRAGGAVSCWGSNEAGQLGQGRGSTSPTPTPTAVNIPAARAIAMGAYHACALLMDGTVRCWGSNKFAQCGQAIAAGGTTCDEGDGTLSPCTPTPTAVAGLSNVTAISLGRNHSCALLADRTVRCWGLNDSAQLGIGSVEPDTRPHPTPAAVMGLSDVASIAVGGSHGCAVRMDGSAACWGWGDIGQLLGAPTTSCAGGAFQCALTAQAVPSLAGIRSIASGRYHTCAVMNDGSLRCGGRNDEGQVGATTTEQCLVVPDTYPCARRPVTPQLPSVSQVTVGDYHSCSLGTNSEVRCWGWNAYGQVGDGTTTNRASPVTVQDLLR